jgi:uncharacterized membrane protein YhhN
MTTAAVILLGLAALVGALDWWAVTTGRRTTEYVAKPATILLLLAVVLALRPAPGATRPWFVLALLFSCAGDVFLMLPRDRFVFGLGAFLLAHVAYVVGFLAGGVAPGPAVLGLVVAGTVAVVLELRLMGALRESGRGRLVGPVLLYGMVITLMVGAAFGSARWPAVVGALLFFASDGMIAISRFLRDFRMARTAIMITYHLGQAGLVLSLVR